MSDSTAADQVRIARKVREGLVVSDKMDKTVSSTPSTARSCVVPRS
jgi:ribosomal protein S17